MSELRPLVDVWISACRDLSALARQIAADEWQLPTDCPAWSVHDVMAHAAALESELAGDEILRVQIDKQAPHIKRPAGIYTERGVAARREWAPAQLIAAFDDAVERRTVLLAAEPLDDPAGAPPITPGGIGWSWERLLVNRPVDIWVHEQDIRRAVGRPGGLDTVAARHCQTTFADALPYVVAKRAAAPAGTAVVFDITGPVPAEIGVVVGDEGRGASADPRMIDPAVRLTLDTESFAILGAGRRAPSVLPVKVDGDEALALRIMESMAVTP